MNFETLGPRWIWNGDGQEKKNQYVCFRKEFTAEPEEELLLHLCADTNFAVWLNEELVGFGGYLAYPSDKYYDTLPLAGRLKKGRNVLCRAGGTGRFCLRPA